MSHNTMPLMWRAFALRVLLGLGLKSDLIGARSTGEPMATRS